MAEAKNFLSRLQYFAESFTGYPVKIVVPSESESQSEQVQVQESLKIFLPREVELDDPEQALNVYKGLTALQASAALYRGIPEREEDLDILRTRRISGLEDFIVEGERGGLIPLTYQTIELSRRMQCIAEDYRVLGEDISSGFREIFNPNFLSRTVKDDKTNEIDLALSTVYWKSLGVDEDLIQDALKSIPGDKRLGIFRGEFLETLSELSRFDKPMESSYRDSSERTNEFSDYVYRLTEDLGIGSVLSPKTEREFFEMKLQSSKDGFAQYSEANKEDMHKQKIENLKNRENQLLAIERGQISEVGLDTSERVSRRLAVVRGEIRDLEKSTASAGSDIVTRRFYDSKDYATCEGSAASVSTMFQEIPRQQLIRLEVPEKLEEEKGSISYFPELRQGVLVPRAIRVSIYDLSREQPPTEQQIQLQLSLETEISQLEREIGEHNNKIHSDINYIYDDLPQIVKKRDATQRKVNARRKRLAQSRKIHEGVAKKEISSDAGLTRRIEREMETIKPAARALVRNCFEGELDEKRFYEWWLDSQLGGTMEPNFYHQWQKRRRDVASVLLIDASQSAERMATDDETYLDLLKQSAYYFTIGAEFLEDKSAVLAYNGRGERNSRVFILKDFFESPKKLQDRLEILRGELNNRDGSAIRYATQYLNDMPAKTRFMFHLGDMKPSDLEFETTSSAIEQYRYEGEDALNDVTHAFDSARAYGIIPIGICMRPKKKNHAEVTSDQPKKPKGKMNLALLKKLKEQKQAVQDTSSVSDERLKRNFQRNYRIVANPEELPKVLRDVYVKTSFS